MLWLQHYDPMKSPLISQFFSEHLRQADLSMLALRVVRARVLVVLSGSFMPQIETGPTLTWVKPSPMLRARF